MPLRRNTSTSQEPSTKKSILSEELKDYFENLIQPLAKSADVKELLTRIAKQETDIINLQEQNRLNNDKIEVLESRLALKENHVNILIEFNIYKFNIHYSIYINIQYSIYNIQNINILIDC